MLQTLALKTDQKLKALNAFLKSYGDVIVAFSGGVDSTFLAEAARRVLADKALAVTAISDSYPEREMEAAKDIAKQIGIRFETVNTDELEMEGYASNPTNRCYFCKTELFTKLKPIAEKYRVSTIVYGAIPDDIGDISSRYGRREKHGDKGAADRRQSDKSRHSGSFQAMGIADMGQTRFACLSSRFPYGTRITRDLLRQVDRAEQFLYDLGVRQFRVRHHEDLARIELEPAEMPNIATKSIRSQIDEHFKSLGYRYVTLICRDTVPAA